MVRTQLSASDKRDMIEHLEHEVAMFRGAFSAFSTLDNPDVRALGRNEPERISRTAFFEVALLHARLLDEFLCKTAPTRDDLCAINFIPSWSPGGGPLDRVSSLAPSGVTVRQSINKQLAHMTTERLQQAEFRLRDIDDEIIRGMRDFTSHPDIAQDSDFDQLRKWLAFDGWPEYLVALVGGS